MPTGFVQAFYNKHAAEVAKADRKNNTPIDWRNEVIDHFTQVQFWVEGGSNPLVADAADTPPNEKPVYLVVSLPPKVEND